MQLLILKRSRKKYRWSYLIYVINIDKSMSCHVWAKIVRSSDYILKFLNNFADHEIIMQEQDISI